jgi:hypothetical protein
MVKERNKRYLDRPQETVFATERVELDVLRTQCGCLLFMISFVLRAEPLLGHTAGVSGL